MGTVKGIRTKVLVVLIVFMIVFSNCGFTLSAIATSDEFQVITNGFFKKDEIKFNAYFEDENGNEITEITENVNQKVRLILDILPQVEGYLKSANLKAVSEDGSDVNFKITGISYYQEESDLLEGKQNANLETNNEENKREESQTVETPEVKNIVTEEIENTVEDTAVTEEKVAPVVENTNSTAENENTSVVDNQTTEVNNTVVEDELSGGTTVDTNTVSGTSNTTSEVVNEVLDVAENNVTTENTVTNSSNSNEVVDEQEYSSEATIENEVIEENNEDILIDEDKIIEEKTEEATVEEDLAYDMKLISDNEIQLRNIIKDTKIVLELEYKMGDKLNVEDLMKNIHLQLSGTYINSDLEEVQIGKEAVVTLGWEYTKDVELTSEYTKFSPFEVGEIKGTIVENKISVKREITDEKYLPIKNTSLEVGVPKVNGKTPIEINVICEKLLATRGEDTGNTTFAKDNWSYDAGTGKIQIKVENSELAYTSGMDEYVIIYRYEDMIDAENSDLDKNVKLRVEEYSGSENHIIEKEIKEVQSIKVDVGELITYNISSTEEKINKAKIYANYNNETPVYETEYTNQVNVNILTSDILEELKINCNQEVYKDENGFEFEAEGIEYRKVKFSFSEITTLLVNGGEIVITNEAGEVLYTLNKEVIKTEEDCEISLNGQTGIIIYARNIAKNGSLNFELVKVIKGCNYEKTAFKNFTSIESRISAEVKYQKIEETLELETIGTAKQFEEATTLATLSINKETLSTTKSNENVEIKIELNNDKENSDLYINPAFEVVFPKYVKEVTIQNANVLYENGLKISKIDTYKENDITRIRVELEGVQKTFSESSITNGTNIIVNANIEVDEYTPKKEDQIKLYYCNEGVSTYQAQTKWSISKTIPNNILKTTNGFDVAIIKYQAPNGLVAINGIVNYDGKLSEIKSVKQGEVKEQIEVNASSKVMTMELLALNNTDNKCTDIVLLGRIPFAGVKDVVTNEDLGTTTNTVMKDLIKEDIQNTNTVDIYYSSNAEATKDLDNIGNGWTKEVSDINEVKSFLIVVKGSMEAGQVLRYTYDFEVPANLPYETNIEGSFGAFYNNNTEVAVVYESSVADTVGLTTEAGPKLEATLSVDVGDGNEVLSNRLMKYTVKVTNEGSIVADDLTVQAEVPAYTNCMMKSQSMYGDYGYIVDPTVSNNIEIKVGTLNPGESKEVEYVVKTGNKPTLEEYASGKDEEGYYIIKIKEVIDSSSDEYVEYDPESGEDNPNIIYEKEYITEVPSMYISHKAKIKSPLFANDIETNEVRNELKQANFSSEIRLDYDKRLMANMESNFSLILRNTSGKDLKNVVAVFNMGDIYEYQAATIENNTENIEVDSENGKINYYIGDMAKNQVVNLTAKVLSLQIKETIKTVDCYFEFSADEVEKEKSTVIPQTIRKNLLDAEDMTVALPKSIKENEEVIISTLVTNIGLENATQGKIEFNVPNELEAIEIMSKGTYLSNMTNDNTITANLPLIEPGESITVDIKLKSKNMSGTENANVSIIRVVKNTDQEEITLEPIEFEIINNLKTSEEEEDNRISNLQKDDEEAQKEALKNDNDNNSNNQNNSSEQNGTSSSNTSNSNNNSNVSSDSQGQNNSSTNNQNNSNNSNAVNNSSNINKVESYNINGLAWIDTDENGAKDESEKGLAGIKVYLLTTNNAMLKSTITDKNGNYSFSDISNGKYVIAVSYDNSKYSATTYKKSGISEDKNSDILEKEDGDISGVTNEIIVENANVDNINIGLINKSVFDLAVYKYISKIKVTNGNFEEEYDYDNEDIAKVEIHSKRINGAKVELEYTIVIENIGEIEGYAEELVDYLDDEDVEFNQSKNPDWVLGNDGNIYAKDLKEKLLRKGEKLELKLILTKTMTEENTGTLSNKVGLVKTYNSNNESENTDNNTNVQNTLILISTGNTTQIVVISGILVVIAIIIYMNRNNIDIGKKGFYKEKVKPKPKMKKVYK